MIWRSSGGADQSGLKEVDLPSSVHLALHQLQFGDLPLGLTVRPGGDDCGTDGGDVFGDALCERGDEARAGGGNPGVGQFSTGVDIGTFRFCGVIGAPPPFVPGHMNR